ncbi:MAG: cytochrome c biogenesis protein CcdA [Dehalococcoidia bacterium]|nr:cytochrome c biogenesis protein CcdA [Dehalococcoidia bacterium]
MDGAIVDYFPLVYALLAGMTTMVSPCSVAMLPSYVAIYISGRNTEKPGPTKQVLRALYLSLVVAGGYVLISSVVGSLAGIAGYMVIGVVPWLAIVLAVGLLGLGGWLLTGRHLTLNLFARAAVRLHRIGGKGFVSFFLFGIAYGLAALSCALPVFLVVVFSAFTARGLIFGVVQLLFYSLGMAIVFTGVAVMVALLEGAIQRWLADVAPLFGRISGGLLLLSGGYILYYWFVVGGLLSLT